jgi:hypothetical protein
VSEQARRLIRAGRACLERDGAILALTVLALVGVLLVPDDWFNRDRIIAALTVALVGATIFYARQTRETVAEMRRGRSGQVMPRLVPAIQKLGPNDLLPRVVNVGVGSALNVVATMSLEPGGSSMTYRAPLLSPGRGQSLLLGRDPEHLNSLDFISEVDEFAQFNTLRLLGSYHDVLGDEHSVDESFDLASYIAAFRSGMWAKTTTVHREGEPPLETMAGALVNIENLLRLERESD